MSDPYLLKQFGNVQILDKIGQGGMGMVYRGRHQVIDKDVAIKLLPPELAGQSGSAQQRFIREARMAASIHHRHVVQVLDAGTEHGVAYMVQELVPGRSLGSILDDEGRMAPERVLDLLEGMAEGLIAIHAQGVVHRDIKPDNMLLSEDGTLKIADLGLARTLNDPDMHRLTATGMVVGTPLYVSPEAIRDNKSAGPQTDVYSLGCTLYHMLCGEPPFTDPSPYEVMKKHLEEQPADLSTRCPDAPPALIAIVSDCLHKDPQARPRPGELLERVRAARNPRTAPSILGIATGVLVVAALALLAWRFLGS